MKRQWIILMLAGTAAWANARDLVGSFYADRSARSVGDLVTVLIEEQSSVSQDASNDRDKSSGHTFSMNLPSMTSNGENLWKSLTFPEWSLNTGKTFDASASKASSDSLSASITVYVTEVLPNGNLMISGDRVVNIDKDLLKFTLTGMIRPDDIRSGNSVLSSRIAGASITYRTVGELAQSSRKGILSRVIDWVIPF